MNTREEERKREEKVNYILESEILRLLEQCKEAFLLLHYHETPAIKSDDFVDVVRGCSLVNEDNIAADVLYKELDLDNNGEMSLEDFTNIISAEDAKAHHVEFLETVLANEEEILAYKKRKAQGERLGYSLF